MAKLDDEAGPVKGPGGWGQGAAFSLQEGRQERLVETWCLIRGLKESEPTTMWASGKRAGGEGVCESLKWERLFLRVGCKAFGEFGGER